MHTYVAYERNQRCSQTLFLKLGRLYEKLDLNDQGHNVDICNQVLLPRNLRGSQSSMKFSECTGLNAKCQNFEQTTLMLLRELVSVRNEYNNFKWPTLFCLKRCRYENDVIEWLKRFKPWYQTLVGCMESGRVVITGIMSKHKFCWFSHLHCVQVAFSLLVNSCCKQT